MFEVDFKPFDFSPTNMVYVMGADELTTKACREIVEYVRRTYQEPVPVYILDHLLEEAGLDPKLLSREQLDILDSIEVEI